MTEDEFRRALAGQTPYLLLLRITERVMDSYESWVPIEVFRMHRAAELLLWNYRQRVGLFMFGGQSPSSPKRCHSAITSV